MSYVYLRFIKKNGNQRGDSSFSFSKLIPNCLCFRGNTEEETNENPPIHQPGNSPQPPPNSPQPPPNSPQPPQNSPQPPPNRFVGRPRSIND